mmetsp:Transcript_1135/g.2959  ORF Transcript_1135/g.2959 Transcript_1135/m.2959 type:complete len:224 (-) Transcript_1135:186-857(-)
MTRLTREYCRVRRSQPRPQSSGCDLRRDVWRALSQRRAEVGRRRGPHGCDRILVPSERAVAIVVVHDLLQLALVEDILVHREQVAVVRQDACVERGHLAWPPRHAVLRVRSKAGPERSAHQREGRSLHHRARVFEMPRDGDAQRVKRRVHVVLERRERRERRLLREVERLARVGERARLCQEAAHLVIRHRVAARPHPLARTLVLAELRQLLRARDGLRHGDL